MKGIIIYSSKTGNTKKMAETIYETIVRSGDIDVELADVKENKAIESYDFALIGAWVDKALPDSAALKLIKSTNQQNLGLFVTMGAMPDSEHGEQVEQNLSDLLKDKNSLGTYKCPGLVDPNLTRKMKGFTGKIVPSHIRDKMVKAGEESRYATQEELEQAGNYFLNRIKEKFQDK